MPNFTALRSCLKEHRTKYQNPVFCFQLCHFWGDCPQTLLQLQHLEIAPHLPQSIFPTERDLACEHFPWWSQFFIRGTSYYFMARMVLILQGYANKKNVP